jgi:quinol monooxygenase YgiN
MLAIAGHLYVKKSERDKFVEGHRAVIAKARKAEGCLDLAISADMIEDNRVNMFELWESQEKLDAWRKVAPAPDVQAEIEGGNVQLHVIARSREPF